MAALAVVHGERDGKMTDTAELAVEILVHGKMLGRLFLDVKDHRMTLRAFEPLGMSLVREHGGGNERHLSPQLQGPVQGHGLVISI